MPPGGWTDSRPGDPLCSDRMLNGQVVRNAAGE
jgi:hypothetical protein